MTVVDGGEVEVGVDGEVEVEIVRKKERRATARS